ncbi:MAG TPA: TRAP transporter substrate-binding protein [Ramlibacter sp.]|uniref:TRAP transporter substrate-binding protein n=1 Tax=Ramlibacter sp. TaxID=1917967 RepID=UPI002BA16FED|nr:TRAP transporter substrate-binding protein [Ramlibacter sp.]HVZ42802.1 TRAP transporter substrate-binding protein [Ramlibacter sp.]
MRRLFAMAAAAAFTAACVMPLCAAAQTELKLGHVGEPGSLFQLSADEFARRVNEKLAGKVKVVTYGSSQLGGDKELIQKLKLGTVDLAAPSTVMTSELDVYGIFELPYMVKDRKHMAKIEREIFWPVIAPETEKKGLKVLAVWENGYRHITNNKHPVRVPEDLKGIKLRVPEGKWRVKMFQEYGANPSPMKFSELFTALQTGVMDGQENPFAQIWSAKLQEVQKYLSLSGHVYTPAYLIAGSKKYATLPADVRKVLEDTARETQAFIYQTAERQETELLAKLKQAGMQVNEVDKDAFIKASKPIYDEFAKEVPAAKPLIDKAIALGR